MVMSPERGDQSLLAELLPAVVEGFRNSIGIERENVARGETALLDRAIPVAEQAHHRPRRLETLEGVVAPEKQNRQVAAIDIPQASPGVLVLGKEQCRVRAVARVPAE